MNKKHYLSYTYRDKTYQVYLKDIEVSEGGDAMSVFLPHGEFYTITWPARKWYQTANGWASKELTPSDVKARKLVFLRMLVVHLSRLGRQTDEPAGTRQASKSPKLYSPGQRPTYSWK